MPNNVTVIRESRKNRTRKKINARNREARKRILFSVSNKNLYAQLVDAVNGKTLVTVSSLDASLCKSGKSTKNKEVAAKLAELFAAKIAEKVTKTDDEKFVFDRGQKLYHGRVKAFAEALREKGFNF